MSKVLAIAAEHAASRVTGVRVKVGPLSHFTPDHFREHFVEASAGTIAEGARVEVECISEIDDPMAQDLVLESVDVSR